MPPETMTTGNRIAPSPPYGLIAEALAKGRVVPFLGAAASYAGVPESPNRLPDGNALAKGLIDTWQGYPGGNCDPLTQVAQFYEEVAGGRSDVYRHLRELFYDRQRDIAPPPTAEFIASVRPAADQPFVVMTTNYDCHIETALRRADRPFAVVIQATTTWSTSPNQLLLRRPDEQTFTPICSRDLSLREFAGLTVVYKLHGGFSEGLAREVDTLVVTESDYIQFLALLASGSIPPPSISTHLLSKRRLLFLGYSLADWNLRVILHQLKSRRPTNKPVDKSWGVRMEVPALERAFWEKRDVVLYDMDLAEFVTQLKTTLIAQEDT